MHFIDSKNAIIAIDFFSFFNQLLFIITQTVITHYCHEQIQKCISLLLSRNQTLG